jgi:drug/metabolite transporter (DMT)-like permease
VVERTLARLRRFRRLKIRYDRSPQTHEAFLNIGGALICRRFLDNASPSPFCYMPSVKDALNFGPAVVGRLLVVACAVGWGVGWPVMKIAMHDWPPLFARGAAGVLAAAGLVMIAVLRGEVLLPPRTLMSRLITGAMINVFAWMGFTAMSLQWLRVSEAALLTFTMPIWATLFAWPVLGERPAVRSVLALCLGVAGLFLLMGTNMRAGSETFPGIALALCAAVLFAWGAVTARGPIPLTPIVQIAWLVGLGSAAMVIVGWAIERPNFGALTGSGAIAIAYMAVGPMALCYFAWFGALKRISTTTASTVILLVPVVGTLSAALILEEPLGLREVLALALTLGGVALAVRQRAAEVP